jgi:hypothetical protein
MDAALLAAQLRIARDAAAHDHCDVVAQIAAQVAQTDQTYYTNELLADPTLGYCLGVPGAQPPVRFEPRVEPKPERDGVPPLEGSRVAGEVLLGGTAAVVGGSLGLVVGFGFALGCSSDCGGVFLGSGLVGVTAGAAFGVSAVGSQDDQHANYGVVIAAAAVGTAAGLGVAVHLEDRKVGLLAIVAAPVISSTVLFNLTRRYDVVPVPTSHGIALAGTF